MPDCTTSSLLRNDQLVNNIDMTRIGLLFSLTLLVAAVGCSGGKDDTAGSNSAGHDAATSETTTANSASTNWAAAGASFTKYCAACHSGAEGKGGLDVTKLVTAADAKAAGALADKIVNAIESKGMPPEKAPMQPTDEERAAMVAAVKSAKG
jgi:uncharacterized membrane protein